MLGPTGVAVIQWLPFNLAKPWVEAKQQTVKPQEHILIISFTSGTSKHHSLWWEISAGGAVRLCWWWWRRRRGPSRLSMTASILSLRRIPSMLIRWKQTPTILHDPQWPVMIPIDLRRSPSCMQLMLKYRGSSMGQVTKAVRNPKEKEFQISGMISKVSLEVQQKVSRDNNGCYYPGSWSLFWLQFLEPSPTGWLDDSSNIFHSKDEKYIPFNVFHASSNIFTLIAVNQSGRKSWLCR